LKKRTWPRTNRKEKTTAFTPRRRGGEKDPGVDPPGGHAGPGGKTKRLKDDVASQGEKGGKGGGPLGTAPHVQQRGRPLPRKRECRRERGENQWCRKNRRAQKGCTRGEGEKKKKKGAIRQRRQKKKGTAVGGEKNKTLRKKKHGRRSERASGGAKEMEAGNSAGQRGGKNIPPRERGPPRGGEKGTQILFGRKREKAISRRKNSHEDCMDRETRASQQKRNDLVEPKKERKKPITLSSNGPEKKGARRNRKKGTTRKKKVA